MKLLSIPLMLQCFLAANISALRRFHFGTKTNKQTKLPPKEHAISPCILGFKFLTCCFSSCRGLCQFTHSLIVILGQGALHNSSWRWSTSYNTAFFRVIIWICFLLYWVSIPTTALQNCTETELHFLMKIHFIAKFPISSNLEAPAELLLWYIS